MALALPAPIPEAASLAPGSSSVALMVSSPAPASAPAPASTSPVPVSPSPAPTPASPTPTPLNVKAEVMGVEQLELDASPLLEEVVDLSFGNELGSLVPVGAAARAASPRAGPSTSRAAVPPDTSGDEENARKLFVLLNRKEIGIPGDGALMNLVSDDEEEAAGSSGLPSPGDDAPKTTPSGEVAW